MRQKWVKKIGNVITILSFLFIIRVILKFDINFKDIFSFKIFSAILILALLLSTSVILNSLAWKRLIEMMGSTRINTLEIFHVYARANLGKYLPGNFMHYASRNILGEKYNISQKSMLYSTILEIMLKILSAFILVILFVRNELLYIIEQLGEKTYIDLEVLVGISFFILVLVFIIVFYKRRKVIDNSLQVKGLVYAFTVYSLIFFINVLVFIVVTWLINDNAINKRILYMSGIYLISWLLGYLTPGSPGGVGIRETIMILMLASILALPDIVLISIVIRITTILADIIAYFGNTMLERKVGTYETNHSNSLL